MDTSRPMDILMEIGNELGLVPTGWGHGYYSVAGEAIQRPRWRLETAHGWQFFAPDDGVARPGDIVVPTLTSLDACEATDRLAQERVLAAAAAGCWPGPS